MAMENQGVRGDGRGAGQDRDDLMRDPGTTRSGGFRRPTGSLRDDLDQRTDRDSIDRRHDWHVGGGMRGSERDEEGSFWEQGRAYGGASSGSYEEPRYGQENYGYGQARFGQGGSRFGQGQGGQEDYGYGQSRYGQGYGGSRFGEGGFGGSQYGPDYRQSRQGAFRGSRDWGSREGYGGFRERPEGERIGESRRYIPDQNPDRGFQTGPETMGRHARDTGGFGGYGGGEYGGSYGGMGPGREGQYGAAGSWGGPSGAGSLSGTYGGAAGWESDRMGMRPGTFALHSMMTGEAGARARQGRGWEREGPLVRDLMTKTVRTVTPDTPVCDVARMMRDEDAGIMPVVHDGRVMGVITDRDLATRVMAERKDITTTRASEVMSEDIHVCSPDDRLTEAVRVMGEENVRRLPVVDRDDRLKGMLSMTDVAREAEVDYALQEALEQIASKRSFWSRW